MSLHDISIRVEHQGGDPENKTDMPQAILYEVLTHLKAVCEGAAREMIDLKALPLSEIDYQCLLEALGQGEVQASVEASGISEVFETRFAGVWWIRDHGVDGRLVAEYLEIATQPLMLTAHKDDLCASRLELENYLKTQKTA